MAGDLWFVVKSFDGAVNYFILSFPGTSVFAMISRILSTILTR